MDILIDSTRVEKQRSLAQNRRLGAKLSQEASQEMAAALAARKTGLGAGAQASLRGAAPARERQPEGGRAAVAGEGSGARAPSDGKPRPTQAKATAAAAAAAAPGPEGTLLRGGSAHKERIQRAQQRSAERRAKKEARDPRFLGGVQPSREERAAEGAGVKRSFARAEALPPGEWERLIAESQTIDVIAKIGRRGATPKLGDACKNAWRNREVGAAGDTRGLWLQRALYTPGGRPVPVNDAAHPHTVCRCNAVRAHA